MLKISESISLPSQGFFSPFLHSTLRYRCKHVFSLGAWSPLIQTGFLVSGPTWDHTLTHYPFPLQGFNLLRLIFSMIHVSIMMLFVACPATPTITSYCGLGSSQFDRLYYGNLFDFFSSRYWDISLPWVPAFSAFCYTEQVTPFGYSWLLRLLAPYHDFSQPITSFFSMFTQGIRLKHLIDLLPFLNYLC